MNKRTEYILAWIIGVILLFLLLFYVNECDAQDTTRYAWDMGEESDLMYYEFYIYQTNDIQYGWSVSDLQLYEIIDSLDLSDDIVYTSEIIDSLRFIIIGAIAVDSADNKSEMGIGVFINDYGYLIINPKNYMKLE